MGNACTIDFLKEVATDLVCIVSTNAVNLKKLILEKNYPVWEENVKPVVSVFSSADVYLGVGGYGQDANMFIEHVRDFGDQFNLKVVALQDIRYLEASDDVSFDCLQAMKYNEKWSFKEQSQSFKGRHLRSKAEMETTFRDWPELLQDRKSTRLNSS